MTESTLVIALVAIALALAIMFGVYQRAKAHKTRPHNMDHEHAMAERDEGPDTVPVLTDPDRSVQPSPQANKFS